MVAQTLVPQTYDVAMYERLNSIMGKLDRRGYVPLTDAEFAEVVAAGYAKGSWANPRITETGRYAYSDLSREHRKWKLAEGDAYDALEG